MSNFMHLQPFTGQIEIAASVLKDQIRYGGSTDVLHTFDLFEVAYKHLRVLRVRIFETCLLGDKFNYIGEPRCAYLSSLQIAGVDVSGHRNPRVTRFDRSEFAGDH